MEQIPYVIIGGGLASVAAADAIRRRDKTGRLVLLSNETQAPYDRVPLSKGYLLGEVEPAQIFLRPARFYERNKVELRLGQAATGLDVAARTVTLADGQRLGFEKLLLATGGRPRRLSLPGAELAGIHYLRDLPDSDGIRQGLPGARKAVVIGGGFIGCELATGLAQLGLEVTVVELTPGLLSLVLDPETSGFMETFLRQQGVTVLTSTAAARFLGAQGRVTGVATNTGLELPADLVLVGVGIIPNTEIAAAAGLPVDNGVIVNEYLEAAPGIYAAGDIARFYSPTLGHQLRVEHYDVALQHGRVAGANMSGEQRAYTELPYFFSHMAGVHIDVVGELSRRQHTVRRGALQAEPGFSQFYFAEGLLQAVLCINGDTAILQAAREHIAERRPVSDPEACADALQAAVAS
ncbi:MAG: NAD(P)/FAD-dependent oxidoreductase [Candidatus Tectimicrobiota bacterium]